MSKDASSVRFVGRNNLKNSQSEANENDFENSSDSIKFPPQRTPLNTIPDPSQYQSELQDFDYHNSIDKCEAIRAGQKRIDTSELTLSKGIGNTGLIYGTPRVSGKGKSQSEPNSVQSTPARSVYRASNVGAMGVCTGPRPPLYTVGKGSSSSRVSRGISIVNSDPLLEVPHFEIVENPLFWKDHNVQVLIRIRPLSNTEKVTQGYGRCLRQESAQTVMWLGHPETRFTFDHISCETISQEKLFRAAGLPMVENCMSGYNSCMFAYGQTGSGKTYTMMGEIDQMDGLLIEDCGITPRVFEYLFSRIREEEEKSRHERLKYSCKCSFLEIYNEQITDLLEPSSTNLQLREDSKKGVYVENLTECNVRTVDDVLKLLLQGAANRKISATRMNSESSRSHSVFTCIIESQWEKDSMTHLRFGRLNLVDLAGSERQKSSGAEGDRLKEAANINKSLSTLGLVIMSLVDLAHGKQRHVPYRDSRLTFLLQDSLGGNSKTTIIANVSPSICSANETLSTLKFAQRAKLIQNNAKVNEDASGDVTVLQKQIQLLKGQLSFLMKHVNISRSLSRCVPSFQQPSLGNCPDKYDSMEQRNMYDDHKIPSGRTRKMKCLEDMLVAALRREKVVESEVRRLEAEIEQMNRFARQREEDSQGTKLMLRFREEKLKRLELLADGLISSDTYLMDENNTLKEEIQLLQSKIDRNPELTRFALENIKLLEQLRVFQDFYEHGERETLVTEVSELRDQLLETLEGNFKQHEFSSTTENEFPKMQDITAAKELEKSRTMNSKLTREVDELRRKLRKYMNYNQASDSVTSYSSEDPKGFEQIDEHSSDETMSLRSDSGDEGPSYNQSEDDVLRNQNGQNTSGSFTLQSTEIQKQPMEVTELEQVHLIEELHFMREENHRLMQILSNKDKVERQNVLKLENRSRERVGLENQNLTLVTNGIEDNSTMAVQTKLDKMTKDLEEARLLNSQFVENHASQLSQDQQIELVREEVEMEMTKTILHLQEEVTALQSELQGRLCSITEDNMRLRNTVSAKEEQMNTLSLEWERAVLELTSFLMDGSKSLTEASGQIESIVGSFPQINVWIGEHVERAAKVCVEKEGTILLLQKSLEDAQKMVLQMEQKLNSLKGVTMALTENQLLENDTSTDDAIHLTTLLNDKQSIIEMPENKLMCKEDQIDKAEKSVNAAFLVAQRLSDQPKLVLRDNVEGDKPMPISIESHQISEINASAQGLAFEDVEIELELARLGLLEANNAVTESCADAEVYLSAFQTDIIKTISLSRELVEDFVKDIHETRKNFVGFKKNDGNVRICIVEIPSPDANKLLMNEKQQQMLHQIRDELAETNVRLNTIRACLNTVMSMPGCPLTTEDLVEVEGQSDACLTSGSNLLVETVLPEDIFDKSSSSCRYECLGKITEQTLDQESEGGSNFSSEIQELDKSERVINNLNLCLRKEFMMAYDSFVQLNARLIAFLNKKDIRESSQAEGVCFPQSLAVVNKNEQHIFKDGVNHLKAEAVGYRTREFIDDKTITQANSFFIKLEEAHTTMKQADFMLNALVKANIDAKELSCMWKQTGEELMVEKARFIEEIKQLKSLIHLRDEENEILQDQIQYSLIEIANSISLLEGSFMHMQREVEKVCNTVYSDALTVVQDVLHCICSSRSIMEQVFSETLGNGFASFVLQQCHVGEFFCKFRSLNIHPASYLSSLQEGYLDINNLQKSFLGGQKDIEANDVKAQVEGDQTTVATRLEVGDLVLAHDNPINETLKLKKELERKEVLLKGLVFDFTLLQESTSTKKDIKDGTEKLVAALSQVQHELHVKTSQLDDTLVRHRKLEGRLADTETALVISNSDLEQVKGTRETLSDQNAELRLLLKDLYLKKSETEEQLEEQMEIVRSLEKEILRMNSEAEKRLLSAKMDIEDDIRRVTSERDQLLEQVCSLQDRLDMAYALADENEAIAVEARQESELSKLYAEQKEEEVKILERSVEELECTINVLEKKVYEMEEEVERHRLIRDSLELELQALRQRLLTVENFTEILDSGNSNSEQPAEDQLSRKLHDKSLELHEARNRIRVLEEERAEQATEIKQLKEYISELLLHAEAQASQYQQKYKTLEVMVREVKADSSNFTSSTPMLDKAEKSSTRTRGSSSPFRCISNLVQQMNLEKDQELSIAWLRIEELEESVASRQKEVCMLNTRLAAAESMTHDVIRDLLGVKLNITNYANLIDQCQIQKLVEAAQEQTKESIAMEEEILNLRRQINDLIEERGRWFSEANRREADIIAVQMTIEQLHERDQLLTAQNEMLKIDKANLKRRVAELDDMLKKLFGKQNSQFQTHQQISSLLRSGDNDLGKRLAHSEKVLSRVNDELAQFRKPDSGYPHDKLDSRGNETMFRKQRA